MSKTSDRIKFYRAKRKLSQEELGKLIGVKHNTISQWESGKTNPNIDFVEKLCIALKVTPSMLMGFDELDLDDKLKDYLKIVDRDNILESYDSLYSDFKKLILNIMKTLLKFQENNESVVIQQEESEEEDDDILIAASGGENADEEEINEAIELAKNLRRTSGHSGE